MEITIHGRGGQGGVTLAKLIATAYFLRGKYVQAFGVYAAERSGAPLQAFVRIDDSPITNCNQIAQPDHVIVLDRTLIHPAVANDMKPDGWLILNTPEPIESFGHAFAGTRIACIDATGIALANGLGTRAVPIVNTTMLGAVAQALGLRADDIEAALWEMKFAGANVTAAREAFARTRTSAPTSESPATHAPGAHLTGPTAAARRHIASVLDPDIGGLPEIHTGTWANRRPQRGGLIPPCNHACPAGNDIQAFVAAMSRNDSTSALRLLLETSPLPGVCGRVCPAPCMTACNRAGFDESINVRELERFAADHGDLPEPLAPWRHQQVAVVGSGPAGLSATYHLARLGYRVCLIEAADDLGGVMRSGIPQYRLPREVLDREIDFIVQHGVTVHVKHVVDRTRLLALTRAVSAVFVATGLKLSHSLDLGENDARSMVIQGIEFLARREHEKLDGLDVVIIGGGNTAIDAARTARRLNAASVQILYRRTRAEMPAIVEEIDEALQEKISLRELVSPLYVQTCNGRALLTCARMHLTEPDETGRRRPEPDIGEDAQFDIRCDRVILALGQEADLSILPEGSALHEGTNLLGITAAPVFAGGDFATNDGSVAAAIGSGRRAALCIHKLLTGEELAAAPRSARVAGPQDIKPHAFSHAPRQGGKELPASSRVRDFAEVRRGLSDSSTAMAEAARCFSCGVCNECNRCLIWCPEGILQKEPTSISAAATARPSGSVYRFDYEFCKGCGICAMQCPRGVIEMVEL